jgi:hypothetical protein
LGQLFPYSLGNYLQIVGTYVLNFGHQLIVEEEYIEAKEAALEKWSENICANINNARNIKDKWMKFRKFFNRKSNNTVKTMTIGSTIHLLIKSPEPLTTSGSIKYKPNVAVESPQYSQSK